MKVRDVFMGIGLAAALGIGSAAYGERTRPQVAGNIALEYFADSLGNQDGVAQPIEMSYLESELVDHGKVFVLTEPGPHKALPPEYGWRPLSHEHAYASLREIRDFYQGILFTHTAVLRIDSEGNIVSARSFNRDPARAHFHKERIPRFHYDVLLEQRRFEKIQREKLENP